jgi:hypothetical protein
MKFKKWHSGHKLFFSYEGCFEMEERDVKNFKY